ncbi:MAG: hypothetical protein XXXJIFNMEKO3_01554 [Candidatus Erwinia impunctatus]|nr:hypothetical protein XXXJIFNMEKO_01554 [Culicoides impunctatus]
MEIRKKGVDWSSLIPGVLFIIVALLSFQNPAGNLLAIVLVFALFAILKGLFDIVHSRQLKRLTGIKSWIPAVIGFLDIVVGNYFLANPVIGVAVLPFVFAIWFTLSSLLSFATLDIARAVSTACYWFFFIINLLCLAVGVILLFNPLSSALTLSFMVGCYFLLFGLSRVVYAFRAA